MTTVPVVAVDAPRSRSLTIVQQRLLAAFGLLALTMFARAVWTWNGNYSGVAFWRWPYRYSDFDQIYMAGWAFRHGVVPYGVHSAATHIANGPNASVFSVYYYLPLCGALAAPLSMLPFPAASLAWRLISFAVLALGLWKFMQVSAPRWPSSARLALLGLLLMGGSVRWTLVNQQPTALIVGLLMLFAWSMATRRIAVAVALAILISVKVSFMLPVIGLLLWRRDLRPIAATFALILALNVLAIVPSGPAQTVSAYTDAVRHMEDARNMTNPSALDFLTPYLQAAPNSPLHRYLPAGRGPGEHAGEQIHLPFIVSAWTRETRIAKLIAAVLSAALLLALGLAWDRTRSKPIAEDPLFIALAFGTMMGISLLTFYHQRYDAVALLPLAIASLAAMRIQGGRAPAVITIAAVAIASLLLFDKLLALWHGTLAVRHGVLIAVPIVGYLVVAATIGGLWQLWRLVSEMRPGAAAIVQREPARVESEAVTA